MNKHLNIKIYGKVVDVDFRLYAQKSAQALGVRGFAKNVGDDEVYVEAEGQEEKLKEFVEWCHKGSPWSEVKSVDISEGELQNFVAFERI